MIVNRHLKKVVLVKTEIDLSEGEWVLDGFMPNEPLIPVYKRGALPAPAVPAFPARVPGSVHDDLLAAGLIPDWNDAFNSNQSEWVNNRHWRYRRSVTVPATWEGKRVVLCADGLDDSGTVLINVGHGMVVMTVV